MRQNQASTGAKNGDDKGIHSEYSSSVSGLQEQLTNLKEQLDMKNQEVEVCCFIIPQRLGTVAFSVADYII